jgi:hypothetical protein
MGGNWVPLICVLGLHHHRERTPAGRFPTANRVAYRRSGRPLKIGSKSVLATAMLRPRLAGFMLGRLEKR